MATSMSKGKKTPKRRHREGRADGAVYEKHGFSHKSKSKGLAASGNCHSRSTGFSLLKLPGAS